MYFTVIMVKRMPINYVATIHVCISLTLYASYIVHSYPIVYVTFWSSTPMILNQI